MEHLKVESKKFMYYFMYARDNRSQFPVRRKDLVNKVRITSFPLYLIQLGLYIYIIRRVRKIPKRFDRNT